MSRERDCTGRALLALELYSGVLGVFPSRSTSNHSLARPPEGGVSFSEGDGSGEFVLEFAADLTLLPSFS